MTGEQEYEVEVYLHINRSTGKKRIVLALGTPDMMRLLNNDMVVTLESQYGREFDEIVVIFVPNREEISSRLDAVIKRDEHGPEGSAKAN